MMPCSKNNTNYKNLNIRGSTTKQMFFVFLVFLTLMVLLKKLHMQVQLSRDLSLLVSEYGHHPRARQLPGEDIVECIEHLRFNGIRAKNMQFGNILELDALKLSNQEAPLHIAFVGDSRIRQHFFTFAKALPPQDLQLKNMTEYHGEMEVFSNLLNLLVTFSWRPNILGDNGDSFEGDVKRWLERSKVSKIPDVILLGMALHDMLFDVRNPTSHELYRTRLSKLRPLLDELNKSTRLIWFSSYQTYDAASIDQWRGSKIFSEAIYKYNAIAKGVFSGSTIPFWDSSTVIVNEYLRACTLNNRAGGSPWGLTSYLMCDDYIHPGGVVLTEAMYLLLNKICR